jgi:hypothetical protein
MLHLFVFRHLGGGEVGDVMVSTLFSIIRCMVVFSFVAIAAGACAPRISNKPMDLESLTADAERRAQLVRQFEVRFVKTRRGELFNGDMIVKGHLVYQKPSSFSMTLKGDVNVEIISDGTAIKLIHDKKYEECYRIEGERDLSRFSDPLMTLIRSVGSGELKRFSKISEQRQGDLLMVELVPGHGNSFERIKGLTLWLSARGDIKKVKLRFTNGDEEETVFESWSLLAQDSPEILKLHRKLSSVSRTSPSGDLDQAPAPDLTCDPENTVRPESSSRTSRNSQRI